jgi:hypothetical protein
LYNFPNLNFFKSELFSNLNFLKFKQKREKERKRKTKKKQKNNQKERKNKNRKKKKRKWARPIPDQKYAVLDR